MKVLKAIALLTLSLSATSASAYGLECTTQSHVMDYLTLDRDGGEETVTVNYLSEKRERFLVLQNANGKIVAVVDNDLDGGNSKRGITMILDEATGKGTLALNGNIVDVSCRAK